MHSGGRDGAIAPLLAIRLVSSSGGIRAGTVIFGDADTCRKAEDRRDLLMNTHPAQSQVESGIGPFFNSRLPAK